jgi:nicotinate-nucleotide--dimethylbenzimidazole phosphoribosyltransferase
MIAQAENARVVGWLRAGSSTPDPAHALALHWLGLTPILELGSTDTTGAGSLLAVPLVAAAIRLAQAAEAGQLTTSQRT